MKPVLRFNYVVSDCCKTAEWPHSTAELSFSEAKGHFIFEGYLTLSGFSAINFSQLVEDFIPARGFVI